jgi:hypothetical protein
LGTTTAEAKVNNLEVILIVEDRKNKRLILLKPPDIRFLIKVFQVY